MSGKDFIKPSPSFAEMLRITLGGARDQELLELVEAATGELLRRKSKSGIMSSGLGVPDDRHTFQSGAMSSGQKPRYDLIPDWALVRIADRFKLGADKYGVDNWQKGLGDRDFIIDRLNHAIEHIYRVIRLMRGPHVVVWEVTDDDLAAVVLNAIFAMGYQREQTLARESRLGKESTDGPRK